jgi:O-antigen ligase
MAAAGVIGLAVAWLAHWGRTGQLVTPTALNLPLAMFLAAALVGLWVAPDRPAALVRLYWFIGAAALYVTLTSSRPAVVRAVALGAALAGGLLAVYFVTQNPWAEAPVKLALINRLGQVINSLVPDLGAYKPHPNVVASLLAVLLPVAAVLARPASRWRAQQLAATLALGLIGLGLLFTESRASILALVLAGMCGLWGWVAQRWAAQQGWAFGPVFALPIGVGLVAVGLVLALRPDLTAAWLGSLPGPNSVVSRQAVFGQAWRLAQDVAFTGGGLASFPARYSTYILDLPVIYLTHAHNTYLNVLVEQGWLGLAGYVGLQAGAVWFGLRRVLRHETLERALAVAGLLGVVVGMVQGVGDATLVASRVTPFWLIPAALALNGERVNASTVPAWRAARPWSLLAVAGVLSALTALGWANRAAWHANIGALQSDRVLLAGFPTSLWSTGRDAEALSVAEPELERALALEPENRTAHFYLGLAAMRRRDYALAVEHLTAAHAADPDHRGILKTLGYSLAWLGRYTEAAAMLQSIPEARREMEVYAWWWDTQSRSDLAGHAAAMQAYLQAGS